MLNDKDKQEIQKLINKCDTADEVMFINNLCKIKFDVIALAATASFYPGLKVYWGNELEGVVESVGTKNVKVNVNGVMWRVAATLLRTEK